MPSGRAAPHQHATTRFPARRPTASRSRSTVDGRRRRRDDRGRPARQPRLPALRAQPDARPARATAAMVGVFNCDRPHRAAERRQLPPHRGPPARELRRRHPAPPDLDCSVATTNLADRVANAVQRGDRRARRRLRHGRGRRRHPAAPSASSPASTRATASAFVNQIYPRLTGGAGGAVGRRLADASSTSAMPACCYLDSVEIDELRHPIFASSARARARQRGRRALPRRAVAAHVEFGPVGCDMRSPMSATATSTRPRAPAAASAGAPGRAVPQTRRRRRWSRSAPARGRHPPRRGDGLLLLRRRRLRRRRTSATPSGCCTTSAKAGFRPRARWRSTRSRSTRKARSTTPPRRPCGRDRAGCRQARSFCPWYVRKGRTWSTTFCRSFS